MYNIIFITIFIFLSVQGLWSQTLPWEEIKNLALKNRLELREQTLQLELTSRANDKIKAQWLPQLAASGDVRWNTQLQTSVIPVGEFGIPGLPADAIQEVKFGLPFNNLFSLNAEQKLFDATRRVQEAINDQTVRQAGLNLWEQEQSVKQQVSGQFFSAVYYREHLLIAQNKLARAEEKLMLIRTQVQYGTALPTQLERAELDIRQTKWAVERAQLDYQQAQKELGYATGQDQLILPAESLTELIERQKSWELQAQSKPSAPARAEELQINLNGLNAQLEAKRTLPTIQAYAHYALLQLAEVPNPVAKNSWFPYNFIGIKAQWNIFDGHYSRKVREDYLFKQQINQVKLQRLQREQDQSIQKARHSMALAALTIAENQAQLDVEKNMLAEEQVRYNQGTSLLTVLDAAEQKVRQSEEAYLRSVYDWLLALLQLRQAMGDWD